MSAVEKASAILGKTFYKTLDTIDNSQEAAFKVTNAAIATGKHAIISTAELTNTAIDTTRDTGVSVLKTVGNTANVVEAVGDTSKDVAVKTLESTGEVVNESIVVTKNSLIAIVKSLDFVLAKYNYMLYNQKQKQEIKAEVNKITNNIKIYTDLQTNILKQLNEKNTSYIKNFNDVIRNEIKLINTLIYSYKMKNCDKGKIYGHKCENDKKSIINNFNKNLQILINDSKKYPNLLKTILMTTISEIEGVSNTYDPHIYFNHMVMVLENYIKKSSELLIELINSFKKLGKDIEKNTVNDGNNENDENDGNNDDNDNDDDDDDPDDPKIPHTGGRKNRKRTQKLKDRTTKRYNKKYSKKLSKNPRRNKSRKRK